MRRSGRFYRAANEGRMAIRAIAVEDDEAVSKLIAQVLASHGVEVVGTAATGEDGVALARRERPDIALVDLGLPKMSGEDVIATVRQELPKTACIALTAVDIPARVLAAMRAGASGYILKPFHAADLTKAVDDVLSGEAAPISPRAAKVLLAELRGDPPDQRAKDGPALSKRELEVLQLLVHGHTYADVAQALGIAEGTVQTYVKRIYEKMDVSTKAEAALLAVARGLVKP
jgi:two-component system, NarL family, nitrate/nitrite response regulator NarL